MPIPLPNLDDRDFDELSAEARALIPVLLPEWTDHNPSDPGIMIVELLAWLTEMQLYRINQIPPQTTMRFLQLLGGPQWSPPAAGDLDAATSEVLRDLHERYRAATPADYEYLVRVTWPKQPESTGLAAVRRVRCVPGRDLTAPGGAAAPSHLSVVIVPAPAAENDSHPMPAPELTTALRRFLDPRRILTVRHHVVGPEYVDIGVSANVAVRADSPVPEALRDARRQLTTFFDPFVGGVAGTGWPFGRGVHPSEVYAALDGSSLVDYAEEVEITRLATGTVAGDTGLALDEHQLVRLARVDLVGYDRVGRSQPLPWEIT